VARNAAGRVRGAEQSPERASTMTLLADREDFVLHHRPHGPLTGDATKPAWNGYCSPGVSVRRGV